jgi:hypothetical protein
MFDLNELLDFYLNDELSNFTGEPIVHSVEDDIIIISFDMSCKNRSLKPNHQMHNLSDDAPDASQI